MLERDSNLVVAPAASTLVVLGILVSPASIGIVGWVYGEGVWASTVLMVGAALIWLSVATIRIEIVDGTLRKRQLFRTQWSVDLTDACVRDGGGGDFSVLPALIFVDRRTGRILGNILKPQFHAKDIAALKDLIGVCVN